MNKNKEDIKQFKKEVENLKPGDGVVIDDKTKYEYGADLHTEGTPLIDPAKGKTISIRTFDFKMSSDPKVRKNFPDNQTLFNSHAKQILTILWGDGLIPLKSISPHVIIKKKEQRYRIIVPCEARLNVPFIDKPKSLNEVLTKTPTK